MYNGILAVPFTVFARRLEKHVRWMDSYSSHSRHMNIMRPRDLFGQQIIMLRGQSRLETISTELKLP